MALSNYQFQFGSFVFGAGTPFVIKEVTGLEDLPVIRNQDDNKGYNDGMFTGRDFFSGRTLTFMFNVLAGNGNTAQTNFNLFQAALNPQQTGTTTLQFLLSPSDSLRTTQARVRSRAVPVNPEWTYGKITAQVTLFCPDPRLYSSPATVASMSPQPPLGRSYNRTYNLLYGGGSLSTSTSIVNNGNATTGPVITITGPAVNPTIGNITTNQYMTVNVSLANTDTLVIDLDNKLITLNGSPARNLVAGNSVWFSAPPGTSSFYFTAQSYTVGTTSASVTYSSAWV